MNRLTKTVEGWIRKNEMPVATGALLHILSLVYGAAVRARLFLYTKGFLRSERLPCTVVSVGNLTVGGTGKTPVVIFLADFFKSRNRSCAILSRGYMGSARGISIVSDGKETLMGPGEAGDEPYLMARRLKGIPVIVGSRRARAGNLAVERFSPEVIILDDGFQHLGLARDLDLVLVDSRRGFGGGRLLPRGILREPLDGIRRADAVLVKNGGEQKKSLGACGLPVFAFSYRPSCLVRIKGRVREDVSTIRGRSVAALSGIAVPESFVHTLEDTGARVVKRLEYPDHHAYTASDIEDIRRASSGTDMVVTTEKDAVRLERHLDEGDPFYALSIDVEVEEAFLDLLTGLTEGGR